MSYQPLYKLAQEPATLGFNLVPCRSVCPQLSKFFISSRSVPSNKLNNIDQQLEQALTLSSSDDEDNEHQSDMKESKNPNSAETSALSDPNGVTQTCCYVAEYRPKSQISLLKFSSTLNTFAIQDQFQFLKGPIIKIVSSYAHQNLLLIYYIDNLDGKSRVCIGYALPPEKSSSNSVGSIKSLYLFESFDSNVLSIGFIQQPILTKLFILTQKTLSIYQISISLPLTSTTVIKPITFCQIELHHMPEESISFDPIKPLVAISKSTSTLSLNQPKVFIGCSVHPTLPEKMLLFSKNSFCCFDISSSTPSICFSFLSKLQNGDFTAANFTHSKSFDVIGATRLQKIFHYNVSNMTFSLSNNAAFSRIIGVQSHPLYDGVFVTFGTDTQIRIWSWDPQSKTFTLLLRHKKHLDTIYNAFFHPVDPFVLISIDYSGLIASMKLSQIKTAILQTALDAFQ